jgi:GxxExxY protein
MISHTKAQRHKEEVRNEALSAPVACGENLIATQVVDAAFKIHSSLGPGLLESVYEVLLAHELRARGFEVERQRPIPLVYNGIQFQEGFREDLWKVIVEIKSINELSAVHGKQVLTYLRLTGLKLGLLINFGAPYIRDGIERVINGKLE